MKELMIKAYAMGYDACPRLESAPYLNEEFLEIIPTGMGFELRTKMYKQYINGWRKSQLDKFWDIE